ANVTFPLSIWVGGTVNLLGKITQDEIADAADDDNGNPIPCVELITCILHGVVDILDGVFGILEDVFSRLLDSVGTALDSLLGNTNGNVPLNILLHSARTCLP